jgi:hypothetical protein
MEFATHLKAKQFFHLIHQLSKSEYENGKGKKLQIWFFSNNFFFLLQKFMTQFRDTPN